MKRKIIFLIINCSLSLHAQTFDFLDFYSQPYVSTSITIPPVYTSEGKVKLESFIIEPYSIKQGIVRNDFYSTENNGFIYENSYYCAEIVEDSRGWFYRERLIIFNTDETLKYEIAFGATKPDILNIIRNENFYDSIDNILVSYDDIHIQLFFTDNLLTGIEFLRGD